MKSLLKGVKYMNKRTKIRLSRAALLGATALCSQFGVLTKADADDKPAPNTPSALVLDEITVSGQRLADERAIQVKRSSSNITDSVTSDEVGKLPDFNAGDAVKRVAGVNILTYQGEPRFVTIRGLSADYNTSLIDGFHVASPDILPGSGFGSRRLYMEMLPSNLASRIDVVKSATPDVDGHAIGGVMNFITHSAYDNEQADNVSLSVKGGNYFQNQDIGGRTPTGAADVTLAKKFGADEQFGLLLNGSYWKRHIYVPQLESGGNHLWFDSAGKQVFDKIGQPLPGGGNGIDAPLERRWYVYDNTRERQGGNLRFDWRPAGLKVTNAFSAYYYSQNETSNRNDTLASTAGSTTNVNQTPASGTLNNITQTVQLGQLRFKRILQGLNDTLNFEPVDRLKVELKGGFSQADTHNPQTWENFQQKNLTMGYNMVNGNPVFSPANPLNYYNLGNYALNYHREEQQIGHESDHEAKINIGYNVDTDDRGLGFKVGSAVLKTDRNESFTRVNYTGMPYSLANVGGATNICPIACSDTSGGLFKIDPALAANLFQSYANFAKATVDAASQFGGAYSLRENQYEGYGLAQWRTDKWQILGGLRYEKTDFTSNGYQADYNGPSAVFSPTSNANRYGNLLPSFALAYNETPDLRTRLAYSKTIGRGKYSDLAVHAGIWSTQGSLNLLQQGNPTLKPRESDNFDLSQEWYIDGGRGLISAAVFYKNIKNEIFNFGSLQTLNYNGAPTSVLVTQAQNSSEAAKVRGFEFNLIKNLDFLPGPFDNLGIIANGTILKATFPITLLDNTVVKSKGLPLQANQTYNLILFYEKGPYHARIAYNYTGQLWDDRYANYTNYTQFYRNRYQAPMAQVNAQVAYDLSENVKLSIEGFNLTSAKLKQYIGYDQKILQTTVGLGPAVLFGVTAKW